MTDSRQSREIGQAWKALILSQADCGVSVRRNSLLSRSSILHPSPRPLAGIMIIKGCKNCRRRHIKCSVPNGSSSCEKCSELGRPCEWEPPFRFKEVDHVFHHEGSSRSRFSFTWDKHQVWMNPPSLRMQRCLPEVCLFTPCLY